jgi:hypothetical protein
MARSRELFLISTTVLCFAVAWLTAEIGLSLALGAFLAGLIITESEYGHQALDHILPFRDVFTSFFFVSVGMLLNVHILLDEPLLVFGGTVVVLLLKTLVVVLMALVLGYPLHTAVVTGLGLAQVGEFAFVLSRVGVDTGLLSDDNYGIFLANFSNDDGPYTFPHSRRRLVWTQDQPPATSPRTQIGALCWATRFRTACGGAADGAARSLDYCRLWSQWAQCGSRGESGRDQVFSGGDEPRYRAPRTQQWRTDLLWRRF